MIENKIRKAKRHTGSYGISTEPKSKAKYTMEEFSDFSAIFIALFNAWARKLDSESARWARGLFAKKSGISVRTVNNWVDGKFVPKVQTIDAAIRVFREAGAEEATLEDLRLACKAGRSIDPDAKDAFAQLSGNRSRNRAIGVWRPAVLKREVPYSKLIDIALDQPPQGSTSESFLLLCSLSFGSMMLIEADYRAEIRIKRASIAYRSSGCHPATNSRFGESPKVQGVSVEGDRWIFTNPTDANKPLIGDPIHGEPLARMQRDGEELPEVTIIAQCDDDADLR